MTAVIIIICAIVTAFSTLTYFTVHELYWSVKQDKFLKKQGLLDLRDQERIRNAQKPED